MKLYRITHDFYYDGELEQSHSYTLLLEKPFHKIYSGDTFNGLWDVISEHPQSTPFCLWEFKKGKRFIQHYDWWFKKITPKNCKPWKLNITCRETSLPMKELMRYDSEKVIQYLKERGITICPIKE